MLVASSGGEWLKIAARTERLLSRRADQPDPEDPIGLPEPGRLDGALEHGDLMAEGEVLNGQRCPGQKQ